MWPTTSSIMRNTGTRQVSVRLKARIIRSKHSWGELGDRAMTSKSPWEPHLICIMSAWAGRWEARGGAAALHVHPHAGGLGDEGVARCSIIRERPGPLVTFMTFLPPQTAPWMAMLAASSSSIWMNTPPTVGMRAAKRSTISVEGVMG